MELDDDNHLCLRCGKTITGLENYVSHRQQQCMPQCAPLLSEMSNSSSFVQTPTELNAASSHDICQLSASDFFLSLNLQSNSKSDPKDLSCESDCSRLDIPSYDNDLVNAFEDKVEMCSDVIVVENEGIDMEEVVLHSEKWVSNFKLPPGECSATHSSFKVGASTNCISSESDVNCEPVFQENSSSETFSVKDVLSHSNMSGINKQNACSENLATKDQSSKLSFVHNPRTFLFEKLCINCESTTYCDEEKKNFACICGQVFFSFSYYIRHLLCCSEKLTNFNVWSSEVFKNESTLIHFMQFKCQLCLFYCNNCFLFLDHLTSSSHCQNAAGVKKPLICLPCKEECTASDVMIEHFSKNHIESISKHHPVIISEKKRNLHCCYCLSFLKSLNYFPSDINTTEYSVIKSDLFCLSFCAYGIRKGLLDFHIKTLLKKSYPELKLFVKSLFNPVNNKKKKYKNSSRRTPLSSNISESNTLPKKKILSYNLEIIADSHISSRKSDFLPQDANFGNAFLKRQQKVGKKQAFSNLMKSRHFLKYFCTRCDSSYLNKKSLKHHINICHHRRSDAPLYKKTRQSAFIEHTPVSKNLYLCDKCGYIGKTAHQLTKHKRSHTGERPFQCKDCNYSSSLSSQLLRHRRLHTGSKPYKCPYCSYICNTQENLRKHVLKTKKHKGKKMYSCQHCDFECNIFSEYRDHLLKFHSEQYPNGDKDISSSSVAGIYDKSLN